MPEHKIAYCHKLPTNWVAGPFVLLLVAANQAAAKKGSARPWPFLAVMLRRPAVALLFGAAAALHVTKPTPTHGDSAVELLSMESGKGKAKAHALKEKSVKLVSTGSAPEASALSMLTKRHV